MAAASLPLSFADTVESVVSALFVMALGVGILAYSYHRHRERQLIRDTPTSEVESMAVGAVELVGTVEAADATVPAMLTDQSCVVVDYEVEEYRWTDDGKEWRTEDAGLRVEPFYLDDGTGRVLVDPTESGGDYDISAANRTRERYDDTADQPAELDAFLTEYADADPDADRKRRYTQDVLPVGAEAYVFGDAEPEDAVDAVPDADAAELVVTTDADTEMFLVSDKTEARLTDDRRYSLALGGLLGVAVFSAGLWWFLSLLGV